MPIKKKHEHPLIHSHHSQQIIRRFPEYPHILINISNYLINQLVISIRIHGAAIYANIKGVY